MRVVAAGLSFRDAPLAVREAAAVDGDAGRNLLRYLVGHGGAAAAAVLSTCNRTEFYLDCPDSIAADMTATVAQCLDPSGERGVLSHVVNRVDADAIEHMFRVASGLDSMVIGEAQVLGQFKAAHRAARETATVNARLDFVMRRAISVAKLVHTHTAVGTAAGSLSDAAVDCALAVAGDLSGRGVLLIGGGEVSDLAARRLHALGARLLITSRGEAKERLARAFGAEAVPMGELAQAAERFDVVIASTGSSGVVLDAAMVAAIQARRGRRPLCLVDLAVPRDVEPAAGVLPGVTLIDIDEVGRGLEARNRQRGAALAAAEQIVEVELGRTVKVLEQRDASAPAISALTRRAEEMRRRELEKTLARVPELDAAARERIDALTQSLVRKLLHEPVAYLRDSAEDPSVALLLREAFGLDDLEIEASAAAVTAGEEPAGSGR